MSALSPTAGLSAAFSGCHHHHCKTMAARISTAQLERHAHRAADALSLPTTDLWCEHTAGMGWTVFRRFGAGKQMLSGALTAREAQQLLIGLEIGASLTTKA